ncbi:hypothetical protein ACFE04_004422 [Oxalis oulophora]
MAIKTRRNPNREGNPPQGNPNNPPNVVSVATSHNPPPRSPRTPMPPGRQRSFSPVETYVSRTRSSWGRSYTLEGSRTRAIRPQQKKGKAGREPAPTAPQKPYPRVQGTRDKRAKEEEIKREV